MVTVEMLTDTALTVGMTPSQVEVLAQHAKVLEFDAGETILDREGADHSLYIVVEGQVNVEGMFNDVVNVIRKGDLLGEVSFIDHQPRTAAATSVNRSVVVTLPENVLTQLQDSYPEIVSTMRDNLIKVLCKKLRTAQRFIDAQDVNSER